MTLWLSVGVIALALFILVYAAARLLGGLREFGYAQRALLVRADQAKQLEEPIAELQRQTEAMQEQLETIAAAVERRTAAKDD
ncbi:hypothetical protein Val02_35880 [Virgisporangium aliadipatigenens]|uniref:Uncharacterized protein n=1 Tax=Virgisporangium aliadipatigenens TaxID=741659 RepID=A0A8J3YLW3_9ACTN|nr:hypothetical protein [Virgisporangium aliadipatigenens]GIJ46702.1 hypothetical protein Val02_35880 [Virgisporangium aliadipatigenens]